MNAILPSAPLPTRTIALVLGGARSGKSRFAEELIAAAPGRRVYLATGHACDGEMAERIAQHRARRSAEWHTVEEPVDLLRVLQREAHSGVAILVDCLTLWLANLMGAGRDLATETERLAAALPGLPGRIVLVSNEVGLGIVPDNAAARAFRDAAGRLHQEIAAVADQVWFVAAGLPLALKPSITAGVAPARETIAR